MTTGPHKSKEFSPVSGRRESEGWGNGGSRRDLSREMSAGAESSPGQQSARTEALSPATTGTELAET